MPKALTELTTKEVSLVTRGAVNRRFAVKKEDAMSSMDLILKAVLEQEAEGEAAVLAQLEKSEMSPKGRDAMLGVFRLMSAFRDEIPADVAKSAPKMAGYPEDTKKGKAKKDFPPAEGDDAEPDADDEEDKKFPPSKKKASKEPATKTADMPPELRAQFEAVNKAQQEAVEKAERLEKALEVERDARLTKEFVEKAGKEFATIGPAGEVGSVLKSLHGLGGDLAGKVEKLLKLAAERATQANLFGQRGHDASMAHGADNSAWGKIEKAAKEMVNKSADTTLSQAQAIDLVLKRNPELYEEYRVEQQKGGR